MYSGRPYFVYTLSVWPQTGLINYLPSWHGGSGLWRIARHIIWCTVQPQISTTTKQLALHIVHSAQLWKEKTPSRSSNLPHFSRNYPRSHACNAYFFPSTNIAFPQTSVHSDPPAPSLPPSYPPAWQFNGNLSGEWGSCAKVVTASRFHSHTHAQ